MDGILSHIAKLGKAQLLEMDLLMEYLRPLEYLYVQLRVHTSLISKVKRYIQNKLHSYLNFNFLLFYDQLKLSEKVKCMNMINKWRCYG